MKRYFGLLSLVMGLFVLLFLVAEALHIPILTDPERFLSTGGVSAALVGTGLLIADVLLPVPSSVLMVSHGALFGVLLGATLSLIGRAGSFSAGYYIGRRSARVAGRFIHDGNIREADALLDKWGLLAIIGTRPIPILSETMSIAAGLSNLPFGTSLLASILGSLPEALLFAITGAFAHNFINISGVFIGLILIVLLASLIRLRMSYHKQDD